MRPYRECCSELPLIIRADSLFDYAQAVLAMGVAFLAGWLGSSCRHWRPTATGTDAKQIAV